MKLVWHFFLNDTKRRNLKNSYFCHKQLMVFGALAIIHFARIYEKK